MFVGLAFTKKSDLRTKKALKITTASRSQIIHKAPAHEFTNQRERKRGQTESLRNSVTVMKGSKDYATPKSLSYQQNQPSDGFFKAQTIVTFERNNLPVSLRLFFLDPL